MSVSISQNSSTLRCLRNLVRVGGASAAASQKIQLPHPSFGFSIVEMVVVPDHFTASVSEPMHHHLLWNAIVRACRTKIMAEAVEPSVSEAGCIVLLRKA